MAQKVKNLPAMQETRVDPWVRKIPWRRERQPTPVFLPRKFQGQRSLACYSPWGHRVRLTHTQCQGPLWPLAQKKKQNKEVFLHPNLTDAGPSGKPSLKAPSPLQLLPQAE